MGTLLRRELLETSAIWPLGLGADWLWTLVVRSGRTVEAIEAEREVVESSLGGRGLPFTIVAWAG